MSKGFQLKDVLPLLKNGTDLVSGLLFAAMFIPFLLQIFMRFVLNAPLSWTEEASGIFFIWMVFWTTAFLVHHPNDHIKFDVIYSLCPPWLKRAMRITTTLLMSGLFLISLPVLIDYVLFMERHRSPVMRIRLDLLYSVFALFVLVIGLRGLYIVLRLLRRDWREHI